MADIYAIDRLGEMALLDDNTTLPVIRWFDDEGCDCLPKQAFACVVGEDPGPWYSVDLTQFEPMVRH